MNTNVSFRTCNSRGDPESFSSGASAISPIIEPPIGAAAAPLGHASHALPARGSRVTLHWTRLLRRAAVCNSVVENAFRVPACECDERLRDERQSFRAWVNELPLS